MKTRIFALLVACFTCVALLIGCSSGTAAQANDPQTQNRQYMSNVNQIMEDISTEMDSFTTAVQEGEVISLSSQLDSVNESVEKLKSLEVPEAMQDIHASYVSGAEELQTALNDYVTLYEDIKAPQSGSFDYSTYGERLAEIQEHYNAGITALQEADNKASEA